MTRPQAHASVAGCNFGPLVGVAALGALALLAAWWLDRHGDEVFARFLGPLPAVHLIAASTLGGVLSLASLQANGWFAENSRRAGARALAQAGAASLPFGVLVICADIALRYPANINVPAPHSFLFYPLMGFIAELCFHVVPLAVLVSVWRAIRSDAHVRRSTLLIVAVAVIEPVFQMCIVLARGAWNGLDVFTALLVFGFGIAGLVIFRSYGFFAMYVFRFAYYAIWHIGWGHIRLTLLW